MVGGLFVGLALLLFLASGPGDAPSPPGPPPGIEELPVAAESGKRPVAPGAPSLEEFTHPESPASVDPARRELAERMARDPERIEVAERALDRFESLLLDATALERVEPGDIRGGMLPRELSHRKMALAAIDTVISHPENSGEIRERSLRVLEVLVRQPWPSVATAEADQFVLEERGHALATLVEADPGVALEAFRGIPEDVARKRVANRAVHRLAQAGMAKEEARARVSGLQAP